MKVPPGPRGLPLIGNTIGYLRDPLGTFTGAARHYGDIARLRLGPLTCYLVSRPEWIEQVLKSEHEKYVKDELTRDLAPLVGNGLLLSEGDFWRRQRKLSQPAFSMREVEGYGREMVARGEDLLASWEPGETRDIHKDMARVTLAIIARTMFGAEVAEEGERIGHALEVIMQVYTSAWTWFPSWERLPIPKVRRFRAAAREVNDVILGIIRRRREQGPGQGDLLDRLLAARDDEGSGMTDLQLRDEAITIYLAGHETTALALTYALHLLAHHSEADARMAEEVRDACGDRPPEIADLPKLAYTGNVVREAMRLYPPAWVVGRQPIAGAEAEIGGYPIPRGTQVTLSPWVVHRDPRWFEAADQFRPERWEDDLIKRLPRGTYFPFGDGPRICIGQHFAMIEAILLLACIARRFRLRPANDRPLQLVPSITLRPKGPVLLAPQARVD